MVRRTTVSSDGSKPLRVAMLTPLPPAHSGTADYAQALIPELQKAVDLEVFERVPSRKTLEGFETVLYQIGNNPYHAEIYKMALEHPGVVVLHEPNVHDLVRGLMAHNDEAYRSEILYEIYGEDPRELPDRHTAGHFGAQSRSFTLIKRLLSRGKGCIVHSRFAEGQVRMKGFTGPLARIPHGAALQNVDGAPYRRRLGVDPGQPLIGMFGYQRPDKHACECLTVFKSLLEHHPGAALVVVGEQHPEVPLAQRVAALGLHGKVHLPGYLPIEDFDGYLAACDVVINLRSPTYGETSGTMMRAFGIGRTVLVSDTGAARELDDEICVRIPCDEYQNRTLLESLKWLLSDHAITTEIGNSARQWVSRMCPWDRTAALYASFLQSVARPAAPARTIDVGDSSRLRQYLCQWAASGSDYLEGHISRLVRTLQLVPPGTLDDRVLEMGCYLQITPALKRVLGYGQVRGCYLGSGGSDEKTVKSSDGDVFDCQIDLFDAEIDAFPYPSQHFDTVVCGEVLEHLQRDPMKMMGEIYRILKPSGILILTTPNAVSMRALISILEGSHPGLYNFYTNRITGERRHAREYTPTEISHLLADSGFTPVHIETGPYGKDTNYPTWAVEAAQHEGLAQGLRGECIFAVGRKDEIPRDRYPEWLYDTSGTE
jgi:glycosyltransferase involved in cell wall biosynthesis/SAM-dependent methyltransferase